MSNDVANDVGHDNKHHGDNWRCVGLSKQTCPAHVVQCHEHDRTRGQVREKVINPKRNFVHCRLQKEYSRTRGTSQILCRKKQRSSEQVLQTTIGFVFRMGVALVDVPDKFREIARLSDEERTAAAQTSLKRFEPRPVAAAMQALSDEDFSYLMGWTMFGRDYKPSEGNPHDALGEYVRKSIVYPRDVQESYLEDKPIGEYLRAAIENLATEVPEHSTGEE